jgi:hypothetical protein
LQMIIYLSHNLDNVRDNKVGMSDTLLVDCCVDLLFVLFHCCGHLLSIIL